MITLVISHKYYLGSVDSNNQILILNLEKAQEVRKVVAQLREKGKENLF